MRIDDAAAKVCACLFPLVTQTPISKTFLPFKEKILLCSFSLSLWSLQSDCKVPFFFPVKRPAGKWHRQGLAGSPPPRCLPPGPSLLFIPAEVLSVFELALPIYMLEPEAVHDVCPRTLKPMSWRLGRETVSLSFFGCTPCFFSKRLDHSPQSRLARQNVTVTVWDILNF